MDANLVDFVIENGSHGFRASATNLEKQNLLRNKTVFKYLVQFKGLDEFTELWNVQALAQHDGG